MKELWSKIREALISALPITAIVYIVALLPWFTFSATTLIAFGIGAVLLILDTSLPTFGPGTSARITCISLTERVSA